MTLRIPKGVLLALVVILLVGAGGVAGYFITRHSKKSTAVGSTSQQPDRTTLWKQRQGADWSTYKVQFRRGYFDACDTLFSASADKAVWFGDDGRSYTVRDCKSAFPTDMEKTHPPDTDPTYPAQAGLQNGRNHGCTAVLTKHNLQTLTAKKYGGGIADVTFDLCLKDFPLYKSG